MIRLAGALLAAGGMAWMGWSAARRLARRERILVQLSAALAQMEREISFRLTPMPQLLGELAEDAPGPVGAFFGACRDGLGELGSRSLAEIWRQALLTAPLDLEERALAVLDRLGTVLGRYQEEEVRAALALAAEELAREGELARAEVENRGRMYRVLGLTAGGLLVILLL